LLEHHNFILRNLDAKVGSCLYKVIVNLDFRHGLNYVPCPFVLLCDREYCFVTLNVPYYLECHLPVYESGIGVVSTGYFPQILLPELVAE
jgi:hypothetical protein